MNLNLKSSYLNNVYISTKDMEIYQSVIKRKRLKEENIRDLYKLNLFLSQELYPVVNLIETLYKNKLHRKMTEVCGTENWFNTISWQPREYEILKESAQKKSNIKFPVRILDDLSLKFWVQTFDKHYESVIYTPAIKHLFPNYDEKEPLERSTLKNIFAEMQNYRNCISHHRVIIHEEHKMVNYYHKFLKLISWMDMDYYKLVVRHSRFLKYHHILATSPYNTKGRLWHIWRQLRRFVMTYIWKVIHIFYKEEQNS